MTEQEAKHTPGPWHVTHGPNIQIGTRYFMETTNSKYPISNADACLIAAAPDLLAALNTIIENATIAPDGTMFGSTDIYTVPLDDIEAAKTIVAKAEGR